MAKLTKAQRKTKKQSPTKNGSNSVTLQQQNIYNMDASDIDALSRMMDAHPDIAKKILSFKENEINIQKEIVELEKTEQKIRKNDIPYQRGYAFLGQFMAYSLGVASIGGAAYFGFHNNTWLAVAFLSSTAIIAFLQYNNPKSAKKS